MTITLRIARKMSARARAVHRMQLVALILQVAQIILAQQQDHLGLAVGARPHAVRTSAVAPQERRSCQLQPLSGQKRRQSPTSDDSSSPIATKSATSTTASFSANNSTNPSIQVPNIPSAQQTLGAQNSSQSINLFDRINASPSSDVPLRLAARRQQRVDTSERLRQLRQLLVSNNYDAYLVTPNDEHGSEYVTDYDRRLRFISGFTGSNGYALVLLDRAILFTDGRYALQAEADLDCNWWLDVSSEPLMNIPLWLRSQGAKGLKVATDARLMSLRDFDYLEEQLKSTLEQSEFALISQDLIDVVWDNHQHESSQAPLTRLKSSEQLQVHPLEFAGQLSWQEKVVRLAQQMDKLNARHYLTSKLDDIAWLLNLRGSDIPMTPLFKAYLLISRYASGANLATNTASPSGAITSVEQLLASANQQKLSETILQAPQVLQVPASQTIKIILYVDLKKITPHVREHLHLDNGTSYQPHWAPDGVSTSRIQVELRDYDVFIMDFRDRFTAGSGQTSAPPTAALGSTETAQLIGGAKYGAGQQGKLLLDAMANVAIHVLAKNYDDRLILIEPLIQRLKAVKNELEVAGMRQAHWRDSLAIAMLLAQLEHDIGQLKRTDKWTEQSAAQELEFFRSLMDYNRGQSFVTISAYGANGAVVHYKPATLDELATSGQQAQLIGNSSTYLLDSGGQYLDGTTDITRTVHFGQPTEWQRETYTRVLMGAVDMMSLVFDTSEQSAWRLNDLTARRHLMELGLDYPHGTGHGIGLYSLVHEQPALIKNYASEASTSACSSKWSRLISADKSPIQANMFTSIEPGYYRAHEFGIRLENVVVTQRLQLAAEPATTWLRFEPISLVPFEPKLIKFELLSNKQKVWLNSYNLLVRMRMTQQINYYLAKIRQSSASAASQPQIQVLGTASSSRLYQQLQQKSNTTSAQSGRESDPLGRENYQRLEASKLQQLLEQAHKWIMAKTELLPLDVAQKHVGQSCADRANASETQAARVGRTGEDEWSALGTDPEGQRLMLAYMSSMPFNDAEAARAAATLAGRSEAGGASQGQPATNESSLVTMAAAGAPWPAGQKCTGIECDLLLLEALNSHQQAMHKQRRTSGGQWSASSSVQSDADEREAVHDGGSGSSLLMDLFQVSSSGPSGGGGAWWALLSQSWPFLGLAALLSFQLAVVAYICVGGGRKPQASGSLT